MDSRALLSTLGVIGLSSLAGCADSKPRAQASTTDDQVNPDQQYPDGAGPNQINFSTLNSDNNLVLHTPRTHWDSYAIIYGEPPNRRRVEEDYYINSTTGAVISDLWHGAKDYRNGDMYVYVQPADQIPNDHQREEVEDGIIDAFDITFNDDEGKARYTYSVRPAEFPDHSWVETARTIAATNSSADNSTESRRLHAP